MNITGNFLFLYINKLIPQEKYLHAATKKSPDVKKDAGGLMQHISATVDQSFYPLAWFIKLYITYYNFPKTEGMADGIQA